MPVHLTRICAHCGIGFEGTPHRRFCSTECRGLAKGTWLLLECARCSSSFNRRSKDVNRAAKKGAVDVFCSQYCARRSSLTIRETNEPRQVFRCEYCKDQFERDVSYVRSMSRRGKTVRYCSDQCHRRGKAAQMVDLMCRECGRAFTRKASRVTDSSARGRRHDYCSRHCRQTGVQRDRPKPQFVECQCRQCGKRFVRNARYVRARAKLRKPFRFCSNRCAAIARPLPGFPQGRHGMRDDLAHRVRSSWEANVCRALLAMGHEYQYEPRTFDLGDTRYTPDLCVDNSFWIEVKGWMTNEAAFKIAKFRELYPTEPLVVVDRDMYVAIEREWASRLDRWETNVH
jgi:hypothetical protein